MKQSAMTPSKLYLPVKPDGVAIGIHASTNVVERVYHFLFSWPAASTLFMAAIGVHLLSGIYVLSSMPESKGVAAGVPIPDYATCLRVTRHSDYSTVDVMVGSPPTQLPALLRLDGVKKNDEREELGRGLRLFAQDAVESRTVVCSVEGWCADVFIVTYGKRDSHHAEVFEFDYRHGSVEQQMYTTASRISGVVGEVFMREGYSYWLTSTHFCYAQKSNVHSSAAKLPITLSPTGNLMAKISDLTSNAILRNTPAASDDALACSAMSNASVKAEVTLFPEDALIEARWLSIADTGIYNTEPDSVEKRRTMAEIGVECASTFTKYERDLTLYDLDCAPYGSCRMESSIPFRRIATTSVFVSLETPGAYWMWVEHDVTLDGLPKLANSTSAFVSSILKMLMITVAAAVVFVRSNKKTASSSWLFKNCVSISRDNGPAISTNEPAETPSEDKWIGFVAVASRVAMVALRFSALSNDNQLRVCVAELLAGVLSLTLWSLRWHWLVADSEEPAVSKLGGSSAIVDSTAAVMMAFSESPTLAVSSSKFDPTARMLVSLLVSTIVLTRCAFSASCCGTLWPVFWKQISRRDYALLLMGSGLFWCLHTGILAVTVCDLFVTPAAHSMSRALVGSSTDLYVLRVTLFFGIVCAGLPRLMSTSRHLLSRHEHID